MLQPCQECPIRSVLEKLLIGQPEAIEKILSAVYMHQSGLGPAGHPIAVFLLLGPTGVGKTHTVESLAVALHGIKSFLIRIDCGEYQFDHEVAKLIGAPPGYLGHASTVPILTKNKLTAITSPGCDISLVLFDEIEKSGHGMDKIMLGILDHSTLGMGDNTSVNFDNVIIFMTSNLGAKKMSQLSSRAVGFEQPMAGHEPERDAVRVLNIGTAAVKNHFSSEFVNRIDATMVYLPLTRPACESILSTIIQDFRMLVVSRMGAKGFNITVTSEARDMLLDQGVSTEYGARELKRLVNKSFFAVIGSLVSHSSVPPGANVVLSVKEGEFSVDVVPEVAATALVAHG